MNTRTAIAVIAVFTLTLTLGVLPVRSNVIPPPGTPPTQFTVSGPFADKIVYTIFADETGEFNALQSGAIDLTDTPLNPSNIPTFCPTSKTSFWCTGVAPNPPDPEFGVQHNDINLANNFWGITFCFGQDKVVAGVAGSCQPHNGGVTVLGYAFTTPTCPNVPAPHANDCTYAGIQWRQGFSQLTSKTAMVASIFGGAAQPLDNLGTVPAQEGVWPTVLQHSGLPFDSACAPTPITGCTGAYSTGSPANYNLKGVCSWDSIHTTTVLTNCTSAFNYPGTNPSADGITWDAGSTNFCDAADHFIAAGIASGKDANCRLTTLQGPGGNVVFAVRSDSPNRLSSGTAEFNRFCDLLNAPISSNQCSRTTGTTTIQLTLHLLTITDAFTFVFSGGSTNGITTNTPNLDWHLYTGANSGGPAFDQQWGLYDSVFDSTICGGSSVVAASPAGQNPIPNDVYSCNLKMDHYMELNQFNATLTGAAQSLQVAMEIFGNHTINQPTISRTQQFAYLKGWQGISDATGIGIATGNFWSLLNGWNPGPAVSGPTIRWGMKQGTSSLNPFEFATPYEFNILQEIYDPLLRLTPYIPTSGLQIIGYMANDYKLVCQTATPTCNNVDTGCPAVIGAFPVGGCVKINLRGDITFQDGVQVTASDVKYSFEAFNATGGIASGGTLNTVDVIYDPAALPTTLGGTEAPGSAMNLYIALGKSNAFALLDITGVPIVPQHLWKTIGSSGPCKDTSMDAPGSGKGSPQCTTDPSFLAGPGADPLSSTGAGLIGSGPFVCASGKLGASGTVLGKGCTSTGSGAVTTGTISLQRFGSGNSHVSGFGTGYFRENANFKQFLWADGNGDGGVGIDELSILSGCTRNFSGSSACTHYDSPSTTLTCTIAGPCIGVSSGGDGDGAITALEKSQVFSWFCTSWTIPTSDCPLPPSETLPLVALQDDGSTYS